MARVDVIGQLTSDEILVIQAIKDGTYFVENGVPADTGDHQNFTLASTPNPAGSLKVYRSAGGGRITVANGDYTMTTPTNLQLASPLGEGEASPTVDYRFSPA